MTARAFVSFRLRCDYSVLLGDRQLQGSFTLFHVCRAQDAELRPLFGSRKRPSAARSVFSQSASYASDRILWRNSHVSSVFRVLRC